MNTLNQPEVKPDTPESVLSVGGILGMLLGHVMCLVPMVCLYGTIYAGYLEVRYRQDGTAATARITEKYRGMPPGKASSRTYAVKYQYVNSAGEICRGSDDISRTAWEQSEIGDELAIEYLDSPSDSRVPRRWGFFGWLFCVLGVCWFGFLSLIWLVMVGMTWRQVLAAWRGEDPPPIVF